MVLDIRWSDEPSEAVPAPYPAPYPAGDSPAPEKDLESLLLQAADANGANQDSALMQQLYQIIPSPEGLDLLWKIAASPADRRRHAAVKVLGQQRQWLASRSRVRTLMRLTEEENDPEVAWMLVWCLRQQDEVAGFLGHADAAVAREAAQGVPLNKRTLPAVFDILLEDEIWSREAGAVLLGKVRNMHPSLAGPAIAHLLDAAPRVRDERLAAVLACLPQVPLFQILLEERRQPDWQPLDGRDAQRVSTWQQLAAAAQRILEVEPGYELVRYLLLRSGDDGKFARRHNRLVRAAVHAAGHFPEQDLLDDMEKLTQRASEDKVERLAQVLVELSERLEGTRAEQARGLLETWKQRSAGLRLRIYQMQHKLE